MYNLSFNKCTHPCINIRGANFSGWLASGCVPEVSSDPESPGHGCFSFKNPQPLGRAPACGERSVSDHLRGRLGACFPALSSSRTRASRGLCEWNVLGRGNPLAAGARSWERQRGARGCCEGAGCSNPAAEVLSAPHMVESEPWISTGLSAFCPGAGLYCAFCSDGKTPRFRYVVGLPFYGWCTNSTSECFYLSRNEHVSRNVGTGGKKKHQQHNSLYITLTARSIIYRERFSILSQTEAASGESQAEPVVNYKTTFLSLSLHLAFPELLNLLINT